MWGDDLPIWKEENGEAVARGSKSGAVLQRNSLELKNRLQVDFFQQFPVKLLQDIQIDEDGDEIVKAGSTAFAAINPGGQVMLFEYKDSHTVIEYGTEGVDFRVI